MKHILISAVTTLLLSGCILDEPTHTTYLIKDFQLAWWSEPRTQALFQTSNKSEYGGKELIAETVFAVGFDANFIIAKQHPNNDDTIAWNNIHEHETWKLDSIPSDTLGGQRSYVKIDGEWHGISNGRNIHHNLYPDKKITYYYILDIRHYDKDKWRSSKHLHRFETELEFDRKRQELGVPSAMIFTIVDKELE